MKMMMTYAKHFTGTRSLPRPLGLATAALLASSALLPAQPAKTTFQQGVDAYNQGNFDAAIAFDTEVIRLNPKNANAYDNRGLAYFAQLNDDQAIADYNQAIRLDPNNAQPYYDRGNAYGHKGNFGRAIEDFNQAIRLNPKDARAYNNRGHAYASRGDHAKAVADYDEAILLDPQHTKSYYNRGDAYAHLGEYGKALTDFDQAIQRDPNYAAAYNAQAWVLATCPQAGLRNGAKAVEEATKAYTLTAGQDAGAVDTLAAACAEAGDFDNAIKWERQCLATPNQSAKETAEVKKRLALYQAHQPYHAEK